MATDAKTGYPSVDRPWLKWYSRDVLSVQVPNKTLYRYAIDCNEGHMGEMALDYFGRRMSFGTFFSLVDDIACSLDAMEIGPGDRVTVSSLQTPETWALIYALSRNGSVANLVYPTLSREELCRAIEDTNSKAIFMLDMIADKYGSLDVGTPMVELSLGDSMSVSARLVYAAKRLGRSRAGTPFRKFLARGRKYRLPKEWEDAGSVAAIVYTSGTTGEPKGVMLSSANLNSIVVQCVAGGKGFPRGSTYLSVIPPFLGFGIGMSHLALCLGAPQLLLLEQDVSRMAAAIGRHKPNCVVHGPLLFDAMMESLDVDLSFLADVSGGGTSYPFEREQAFNRYLEEHGSPVRFTAGYGMSELGSMVCMQLGDARSERRREGSVGIPLPLSAVRITDVETGADLPYGEVGELLVSSPSLMLGYWRNEAATDEVIVRGDDGERWIRTGDLGRMDEDGFVYIEGRVKRIYTTYGADGIMYKLFPQRIEELIARISGVVSCGVAVLEDDRLINVAHAFVSLEDGADTGAVLSEIDGTISSGLPQHMRPISVSVIDSIPLTPAGKVDYRELERRAEE